MEAAEKPEETSVAENSDKTSSSKDTESETIAETVHNLNGDDDIVAEPKDAPVAVVDKVVLGTEAQSAKPSKPKDDGGLLILDISKQIAKTESDNSEEDDIFNDFNRNKGRKRRASDDKDEFDKEKDMVPEKIPKLNTSTGEEAPVNKGEAFISDLDLNITKESLGKGKRARIPNKRYSDIIMSPNNRGKSFENGAERTETDESTAPKDDIPVSPPLPKKKLMVDVTNPAFQKPFNFGWKRELVWRAFSEGNNKVIGDVYYYTPAGKKIRSLRELRECIAKSKDLTMDNFTFAKETLGVNDPEKEILRDAKKPSAFAKKVLSKNKSASSSPKTASPKTKGEMLDGKSKASPRSSLGNFKIKAPSKGGKSDKKGKQDAKPDERMDIDPPSKSSSARKSGKWSNKSPAEYPSKFAKRIMKPNITTAIESKEDSQFMANYLQNVSYGYLTLLYVFQYLKVQDLLRAGCVCTMWRDIANHSLLWRTVRMKNSQVHSFEGFANTLKKHGTVHLDLRKMLLPAGVDEIIWPQFSEAIEKVDTLRKIELCRCPSAVVEKLASTNPELEVLNAVTIKCETMCIDPLVGLKNIKELRLKSTMGLNLTSDIHSLQELKTLTHLSLTSVRKLNTMNLSVIAELTKLESLDLGECSDFPEDFGETILFKLKNLEKLRLEKGQGNCHTFEILEAVKSMRKLEQLELVNFDIKSGFDKALGACTNIKKLLIIPTYISQSATTNHMVLGGVLRLQKSLSHFVWGVTLELLRVTELFVDQCEEPDKKEKKEKKKVGNGDSIPVLKPVPLITDKDLEIPPAQEPPQVEILPLPNLQKLLLGSLPNTRVKILKIPFHATWRQSITDSVN